MQRKIDTINVKQQKITQTIHTIKGNGNGLNEQEFITKHNIILQQYKDYYTIIYNICVKWFNTYGTRTFIRPLNEVLEQKPLTEIVYLHGAYSGPCKKRLPPLESTQCQMIVIFTRAIRDITQTSLRYIIEGGHLEQELPQVFQIIDEIAKMQGRLQQLYLEVCPEGQDNFKIRIILDLCEALSVFNKKYGGDKQVLFEKIKTIFMQNSPLYKMNDVDWAFLK